VAKSDDAARLDEQAGQLVIEIPKALENHQPCEFAFVLKITSPHPFVSGAISEEPHPKGFSKVN